MRVTIGFFPYTYNNNTYISMIQHMLAEECCIFDYKDCKKGIVNTVDILFLNWIEDYMEDTDYLFLEEMRKKGKKIIWTFHNKISHQLKLQEDSLVNIKFLINISTHIVVLSKKSMDYLYEYCPEVEKEKIYYIPHPDYLQCYGYLPDKEIEEKITGNEFVFGFVGSLRKDKNADILIKAFNTFPEKEKCKLLIAGEPESKEYMDYLIRLKNNNFNIIIVPGNVKDYMMNFYYMKSDIIVMPYDCKSCMNSGVMILAFTNKKTVIVSDLSMSYEYDERLIYRYNYIDTNHVEHLVAEMKRAYIDGKENVKKKGIAIFDELMKKNRKEMVKKKLYNALQLTINKNKFKCMDKYLLIKNHDAIEKWLIELIAEDKFFNILADSKKKIAIYGYGKYGMLLLQLMNKRGISIECVIDKTKKDCPIPLMSIEDIDFELDYIIVSTIKADIPSIRKQCTGILSKCYVLGFNDL